MLIPQLANQAYFGS